MSDLPLAKAHRVDDLEPIFIGGVVRSGTTLLGSVLGRSPGCVCPPEARFLAEFLENVQSPDANSIEEAERFLDYVSAHWRFRAWNIDPTVPDVNVLLKASSSPAETMRRIVEIYAREHGHNEVYRWIDHTPWNLRYASVLRQAFPRSRFVHIIRDPRGFYASISKLPWGPNAPLPGADLWLAQIGACLAAEEYLEDAILRVRYEDLLENPVETLKGLCDFLQIEYVEEMLSGGGFDVPRYTLEQHALVARPLDSSRVRAWESELNRRDVEIIETHLGTTLEHLGYSKVSPRPRRPARNRERLLGAFRDFILRFVINPPRNRWRRRLLEK